MSDALATYLPTIMEVVIIVMIVGLLGKVTNKF